jgi:hypothetical protein
MIVVIAMVVINQWFEFGGGGIVVDATGTRYGETRDRGVHEVQNGAHTQGHAKGDGRQSRVRPPVRAGRAGRSVKTYLPKGRMVRLVQWDMPNDKQKGRRDDEREDERAREPNTTSLNGTQNEESVLLVDTVFDYIKTAWKDSHSTQNLGSTNRKSGINEYTYFGCGYTIY